MDIAIGIILKSLGHPVEQFLVHEMLYESNEKVKAYASVALKSGSKSVTTLKELLQAV